MFDAAIRPREKQRGSAGVVPEDPVRWPTVLTPHFHNFPKTAMLANLMAFDDQLVSDFGVHGKRSLQVECVVDLNYRTHFLMALENKVPVGRGAAGVSAMGSCKNC